MTPTPYLADPDTTLYLGDAATVLGALPAGSVDCVVTSPPYWSLRDYGNDEQLGLEETPGEYVASMTAVFQEVRRVLAPHGTVWLNLGDSYAAGGMGGHQTSDTFHGHLGDRSLAGPKRAPAGLKVKDLVGIPWRVAFALQADGWWLRSDVIWAKPNPMPESVTDRPTKSHEYLFLLTKEPTYYFDQDAVREPHESTRWGGRYHKDNPSEKYRLDGDRKIASAARVREDRPTWDHYPEGGRNVRTVWSIPTQPYPEAHFATYPEELVRRCILAGCKEGGMVLDPFVGSGTTCLVARNHGRHSIGIDLNEDYLQLAATRLQQLSLLT